MKARKPHQPGRSGILLLVLLYLAHNDFWNWGKPELFLGFPVVLLYHIAYCLAVTLVFLGLTRSLADSERPPGGPK